MRQKSIAALGPILLVAALMMLQMLAPAQAAPPYDPSAAYKIINKKSGRALSVHQGGSNNGSPAILWDFINAEDQLWHIVDIGAGFYKIVNNHSGRVLSTLNGGSDDGTIIHIWDYLTTFPDQHWVISPGSPGFVKITNRNGAFINQNGGGTVSCLDGGTANDTTIHLWHYLGGFDDQDWSIIPVTQDVDVDANTVISHISPHMTGVGMEDVNHETYGGIYSQMIYGESFQEPSYDPNASYKIINKKSGTALSVHQGGSANGSRAILWDFINAEDQLWHIVDIGGSFYKIMNNHSGRVLSTLNGGSGDGTIIHIWDYLTTFPDQHWVISPGSSGFVKITNRNGITNQLGGGTVSCRDGGTANDTTIHLWHYLCGFDDQDWSIIPVSATQNTVSGMWRSFSKGSATGSYSIDTAAPFKGSQSQRISYTGGDGEIGIENQSLNRWGMNIQAAKPYDGYVYLRTSAPTTVHLAFESQNGERVYAETSLTANNPRMTEENWTRYDFTLTPNNNDPHGRFAIKLKHAGSINIGHVFLEPGTWGRFNDLPVRKDIADGVVAQGNTILRFGGTAVNDCNYRWKNMIGPRDLRPATGGHWYPYESNGWGIIDFLNFAESAGVVGIPAVNINETPQDMSDFMDYVNGPTSSFWGQRRAGDGHPAPYHLRYLELGNEEVVDQSYFDKFHRLATAIWAKDPNIILVVAGFQFDHVITDPNKLDGYQQILNFARVNNREVWFDSHVGTNDVRDVLDQITALHSLYTQLGNISPGARYRLVVFELNAQTHNMNRALANALAIGMMQRLGDEIQIVTSANALQPDGQNDNGWDQGLLFFNPTETWSQPPYFVTQMKSNNYQPLAIRADVSGRESVTFDVTATKSADGRTLALNVVNTIDVPRTYSINLNGFNPLQKTAHLTTLTGAPGSQNSSTNPHAIVSSQADVPYDRVGNIITFTFAPNSYTILRLQ
jgi:alpha-L-arabinofuranosidase